MERAWDKLNIQIPQETYDLRRPTGHDPKTQLQMYYLRQSTCKHLLPGMWLEWSSTPEMRHLGLNFRGVK